MPIGIARDQANPSASLSVGLHRARESSACTTEGALPCDGRRAGPVSMGASMLDIGDAAVRPFRLCEQRPPIGFAIRWRCRRLHTIGLDPAGRGVVDMEAMEGMQVARGIAAWTRKLPQCEPRRREPK